MIQTKINLKLQGSRSVVDSPLYLYQDTENLHVIINLINNKFTVYNNMYVSYTVVLPTGETKDFTNCFIKHGETHIILDGADFGVGQNLIQLKYYNKELNSTVGIAPFVVHVLAQNGDILVGEYEECLLSQDDLRLLDDNHLALNMERNVKISDLPTTDIVQGYVPILVDGETKKLDMSDCATKTYVQSEIAKAQLENEEDDIDLSGYATKDDLKTKADIKHEHKEYLKEHQSLDHLALADHNHDEVYIKEHQSLEHLATKEELAQHNHDDVYLKEHQDISHLATVQYVDDAIKEIEIDADSLDLTNYVTKTQLATELDAKASKDHNHSQYALTDHNHSQYLTEKDISGKADKSYVDTYFTPNIRFNEHVHTQYVTEYQVDQKLTGYATKNELNGKANEEHYHDERYSQLDHTHNYAHSDHTHNQYAEVGHVHYDYAEVNHDHDTEYANIQHSHDEYASSSHTHNQYLTEHQNISHLATKQELSGYSTTDHAHDDDYAKKTHTHSVYALTDHTHTEYAPTNHNHNSDYANKYHNHDEDYAKKTHSHTGMLTSNSIVRIEVVDTLPTTQETGVLYIVKASE